MRLNLTHVLAVTLMPFIFVGDPLHVSCQRTSLDEALRNLYRPLRLLGLQFIGRSGESLENVEKVRSLGVSI